MFADLGGRERARTSGGGRHMYSWGSACKANKVQDPVLGEQIACTVLHQRKVNMPGDENNDRQPQAWMHAIWGL